MQHNFVKFGDNWIKFGNLSYIRTCNRYAKFQLKIHSRLAKIDKSRMGVIFFDSHCTIDRLTHNANGQIGWKAKCLKTVSATLGSFRPTCCSGRYHTA